MKKVIIATLFIIAGYVGKCQPKNIPVKVVKILSVNKRIVDLVGIDIKRGDTIYISFLAKNKLQAQSIKENSKLTIYTYEGDKEREWIERKIILNN